MRQNFIVDTGTLPSILSIGVAKQLGLPLPAALGIFSGLGDFSRPGDSLQMYTLNGFPGRLQPLDPDHLPDDQYVGKTDRKDPVLSPIFADLHGMPPSLLVTSSRDILLSGTSTLQRALLRAGDDAQLVVFEALPRWIRTQARDLLGLWCAPKRQAEGRCVLLRCLPEALASRDAPTYRGNAYTKIGTYGRDFGFALRL